MLHPDDYEIVLEALEYVRQNHEAFWSAWAIDKMRPSAKLAAIDATIARVKAQRELDTTPAPPQVDEGELPAPDWSNAPSWAMWWAVDKDGESYWYEKEPVPMSKSWDNISGSQYERETREIDDRWRTTLQPRRAQAQEGERG